MWTVGNCACYDRSKLRYPGELSDEEGALFRLEIPRARRRGNTSTVDVRLVMNSLMYLLSTGCQRRAIDLLPTNWIGFG